MPFVAQVSFTELRVANTSKFNLGEKTRVWKHGLTFLLGEEYPYASNLDM